jgi:ribose 5-phosphate isomerase A
LTIDGADEVEQGTLNLIKGRGGALLREKIVAAASARMVVVVDESKLVDRLGTHVPLPVEVIPFGWQVTLDRLSESGSAPALRRVGAAPFVTDGGNYIADCVFPGIADPAALHARLATVTGIVKSGLFVGLAGMAIVGTRSGIEILGK